jgi:hypothetical protein
MTPALRPAPRLPECGRRAPRPLRDGDARIPGGRRLQHRSRASRNLSPAGTGEPVLASDRPRRQADGRLDGDPPNPSWWARRSTSTGSLRKAFTASWRHRSWRATACRVWWWPSAAKTGKDFAERDVNLLAGFAPHLGRVVSRRPERERFSPKCTRQSAAAGRRGRRRPGA